MLAVQERLSSAMCASFILVIGISLAFIRHLQVDGVFFNANIADTLIVILCCGGIFSLANCVLNESNSPYYRSVRSVGTECMPLVPVSVLLSRWSADSMASVIKLWCHASLIVSLLCLYQMVSFEAGNQSSKSGEGGKQSSKSSVYHSSQSVVPKRRCSTTSSCLALVFIAAAVLVCVLSSLVTPHSWTSVVFVMFTVSLQTAVQHFIPRCLPRSFTPGEAAVVAQGTGIFAILAGRQYISAAVQLNIIGSRSDAVMETQVHISVATESNLFIITAVLSCLIVLVLVALVPLLRSTLAYYALVLSVIGGVSLPILSLFYPTNFISWLIDYIETDSRKIGLFCYWTLSCLVSIIIVSINASKHLPTSKQSPKTASSLRQPDDAEASESILNAMNRTDELGRTGSLLSRKHTDQMTRAERCEGVPDVGSKPESLMSVRHSGSASTSVRKQFHLLAIVVFLPGLVIDTGVTYMAVSCALIVLVMLETVRIFRVEPLGQVLDTYFKVFVDEKDEGVVLLTHIYLLAGMSLPLWLHADKEAGSSTSLSLFSGLISVGVGDTTASIIGSTYGRHKWNKEGKKSIEGSIAAVIAQVSFLVLLSYVHTAEFYITISWSTSLVAIVLVTLLEAYTTQIDNIVLPLFLYIMLV